VNTVDGRKGDNAMAILWAVLLVGVGVSSLLAYGGTPHYGPTTTCGPITVFNQTFSVGADCRIISFIELALALICFMFAVFLALGARPRRPPPHLR